ncbi:MAG: response regulator, partial [Candidatus Riflebacteria bacterium]|nr:response regulator [Candidatus Riflebacteria bacterium]
MATQTETGSLGTLLVVDDDQMARDMLARRLGTRGYSVQTASDGPAALASLDGVDLVLLDVSMPGMDGFEVLRLIRRKRDKTELPVLMVTAHTESQEVIRALESGANDYITKPIDLPVTLARIKTHLSLRKAEAQEPSAAPPSPPPLQTALERLAATRPAEAIVPLQQALRSVADSEKLTLRFLLARAFLGDGQARPALEVIDQMDLRRLSLEQRYELGRALETCEELQQARRFYASVAAEDSGYRDLSACLARVDAAVATSPRHKLEENLLSALPVRYKGPRIVGQGGMGVVFRATDEQTGTDVALKVLSPMLAADTGARRRFLREARTLADLEHPGIVKIFEVAESPVPFYAMEYLEGATLAALIADEGPLEPKRAAGLVERAVDALDYCHHRGLIHRDIKPA